MMPLDSTTLFLIFCVQLLIIAPHTSDALSCPPCDRKTACANRAPIKCAYGRVLDACGCCSLCGNGPNEPCGGEFLMLGVCGKGLECRSNHATEVPEFAEGVCVRTKAWIPRVLKNQPYTSKKGTRRVSKPIKIGKMQQDEQKINQLPPGFKFVTPHINKPTSTQQKRRPLKNI